MVQLSWPRKKIRSKICRLQNYAISFSRSCKRDDKSRNRSLGSMSRVERERRKSKARLSEERLTSISILGIPYNPERSLGSESLKHDHCSRGQLMANSRIDGESERRALTRAIAKTFTDRLNRTTEPPYGVRFCFSPIPIHPEGVWGGAEAEGDREPPSAADPARCTESSPAALQLSIPATHSFTVHDTVPLWVVR